MPGLDAKVPAVRRAMWPRCIRARWRGIRWLHARGRNGPSRHDHREQLGASNMKVLVAGDRGYIGAVLVPLFRAAGHDVDGLDVGLYDGCDLGPFPAAQPGEATG